MPIYPPGTWVNPETRPDGSSVAGAGRIRLAAGGRFDRHHHDGEELWLISSGRALIEIEGERRIANAGDIVLLPGGMAHDIRAVEGELTGFFVELQTASGRSGHLWGDLAEAAGHEVQALEAPHADDTALGD